jgi:hypothetical protein
MIDEQTTTATGHQLLAAWLQASGCLSSAASVANYAYPAVFLGYWLLAIRYRLFWPLFRNPRSLSFRSLVPLFPWSLLLYRRRPRRLSWGGPRPPPLPCSLVPVPRSLSPSPPESDYRLLSSAAIPANSADSAVFPRPRSPSTGPGSTTHCSPIHSFTSSLVPSFPQFTSSLIQFFTYSVLHSFTSSPASFFLRSNLSGMSPVRTGPGFSVPCSLFPPFLPTPPYAGTHPPCF